MTEDTIENLNCEILIQPNKLIKLVPKLVLVILMVAGLNFFYSTYLVLDFNGSWFKKKIRYFYTFTTEKKDFAKKKNS
jgi:uncharacterized membrane protein SirB2